MRNAWLLFSRGMQALNTFLGYLSAFLIVLCSGVLLYEVIMRYYYSEPTDWGLEFSIFMLIASTFLAAAYTQLKRAHVGIEVLDEVLSLRWNRWRYLLADTLSLLVVAFIAGHAWIYCYQAWNEGWRTESMWEPPLWIPYFFMAFGMTTLAIQFVIQIVEEGIGRFTKPSHEYLGE